MAKSNTTTTNADEHLQALYRIKGSIRDIRAHAFPKMGARRLAKMQALVLLLEEQCVLSEDEVQRAKTAQSSNRRRAS